MVEPSILAETVTPSSFWPADDEIAPRQQLIGGLSPGHGQQARRADQQQRSQMSHGASPELIASSEAGRGSRPQQVLRLRHRSVLM